MTKFVVILGFLLSFAAGLVIGSRRGAVVQETTATPTAPTPAAATQKHGGNDGERRSRSGFLTAELSLTPDQRKRLDEIWTSMAKANDQDDQRRQFRRERDAAIADLVPPARLGDYDQIIDAYHARIADLERRSREAYEGAVEQTKAILTPEQRTRYEDLLKRHRWGSSGAARDRSTTRRSETRATSQPGGTDPITSSHDLLKGASR